MHDRLQDGKGIRPSQYTCRRSTRRVITFRRRRAAAPRPRRPNRPPVCATDSGYLSWMRYGHLPFRVRFPPASRHRTIAVKVLARRIRRRFIEPRRQHRATHTPGLGARIRSGIFFAAHRQTRPEQAGSYNARFLDVRAVSRPLALPVLPRRFIGMLPNRGKPAKSLKNLVPPGRLELPRPLGQQNSSPQG